MSVSSQLLNAEEADTIDVGGRIVMPGLCDAHVHVTAATANIAAIRHWSPSYMTARAAEILEGMLMRGFTTVRDAAGADWGLAKAVEEGFLTGPRVFFCGHGLSQTGGHGDMRSLGDDATAGSEQHVAKVSVLGSTQKHGKSTSKKAKCSRTSGAS